jgi:exodeoxyribonuclease-1
MAKLIKEKAPNLWTASQMTCSKVEINQIVEKEKIFATAETYYGKTVPFVLTFCCYHPKYSYAMSLDLKHHPENYINLPYDQLKAELKKSPKILRTVRNNKFAVLMNGNYAKSLEGYKQIGMEKLIERANMIAANKDFKERVSQILLEEADEKEMLDSNIGLEPEEQIYSGGFNKTPKDEKLILEFHEKNDWKEKFLISEKFDDPRFVYFAQRLIYEESPTSLPETVFKRVHRKIAEQINSINNEKWNTLAKSTKEIDDLRVKHENDEQKLKLLDDIDEFLEEIRQQYETA